MIEQGTTGETRPAITIYKPDLGIYDETALAVEWLSTDALQETMSTVFGNAGATERNVRGSLNSLLAIGQTEEFRLGEASNLGVGLSAMFKRYPHHTFAALREELPNVESPSVLAETLRTIGRLSTGRHAEVGLHFIAAYLKHSAGEVRDAALVALSEIDDRRAAPYLESAIGQEGLGSLRADMQEALEQLGN